jgi:hypothetical protein
MPSVVDLVMFGIESIARLARAGRVAHVEDALRGRMALPLPPSFTSLEADMRGYVLALENSDEPVRRQLFERDFRDAWRRGDEQAVRTAWLVHVRERRVPGARDVEVDFAGLLLVGQWSRSRDPLPSALQRLAGTMAGLVVDWYRGVPGALNENTSTGRRLKALLQGLEDADFSESRWDSIVISLFIAGLEALGAGEESETPLARVIVREISRELRDRLQRLAGPDALDAGDRLKAFAILLLRSLLRGTGSAVLEQPRALGLSGPDEAALVAGVGSALMDLLVDESLPLGRGFRSLVSEAGIERLTGAALRALAAHPGIFGAGAGAVRDWLKHLLNEVAQALERGSSLSDPAFLLTVVELALQHAREDLWDLPGGVEAPVRRPLFAEVTHQVLRVVGQPTESGTPATRWRFGLSQRDVVEIIDAASRAASAHPLWLLSGPSRRRLATWHTPAILEVLARAGRGGSAGLLKALLRAGRLHPVLAAVFSSGILDRLIDRSHRLAEPAATAAALRRLVAQVAGEGLAGTERALEHARLFDLLLAIRKGRLLRDLLSGAREHTPLARGLVAIVAEQRAGEILTVSEMIRRLQTARKMQTRQLAARSGEPA